MESLLQPAVTDRLFFLTGAIAVFAVIIFVPQLFKSDPLSKFPLAEAELGTDQKRRNAYLRGAKDIYRNGYQKFKGGVFRIITSNTSRTVVVPPKYMDELRKQPDDVLSMKIAMEESMEAKYTRLRSESDIIPHAVRSDLTPALVRLNPQISEEVTRAFESELPPCTDWTSININHKLLRIVALVSGSVFIGRELCRSEEYLDASVNYTLDIMTGRAGIKKIRPILRPILAHFLPELRQIKRREQQATNFIRPVVKRRRDAEREDPDYKKPDDILQWLMDKLGDDEAEIAKCQLVLSFAAIHTTTLSATNVIYDLAGRQEYIEPLREEIRSVLAEHNGIFTSVAMQNMKKLDSFLKESLRMNPPSFTSFLRKVLKPIHLSSGELIPAGTIIELPAHAITHDPDLFDDYDTFDGMRYYNLRQKSAAAADATAAQAGAAKNQFVSVSQQSLTFGYGRHACPGRFFAANEIKMIIAKVLLEYDMKLDGDAVRYKNIEFGTTSMPDPSKEVLFRKITA